jgi:hypothetical protein
VELRDQKAIIDMLRSHNDYRWGEMAEITRVSWLKNQNQLDFQKQASSIIIEFTTSEPANAAIYYGVNWDSRSLIAEKYNHDARIKQCYHCQQFGHIGTQCQSNHPVCTFCAQHHETRACPKQQ